MNKNLVSVVLGVACGLSLDAQAQDVSNISTQALPDHESNISHKVPLHPEVVAPEASEVEGELFQTGRATYYSANLHGSRTSDGGRYNKNAYTCAHRTLPFGTIVKVVNKKNGKWTIVKVTDRGPFGKTVHIDLSYVAAKRLNMLNAGVVPVDIYVMPEGTDLSNTDPEPKEESKDP